MYRLESSRRVFSAAVFWFAHFPTSVAVASSHPTDRSHADTTWEDIVRDDYSTFHVADYDPETGELVETGATCSAAHKRRSLSSVTDDVARCSFERCCCCRGGCCSPGFHAHGFCTRVSWDESGINCCRFVCRHQLQHYDTTDTRPTLRHRTKQELTKERRQKRPGAGGRRGRCTATSCCTATSRRNDFSSVPSFFSGKYYVLEKARNVDP